MGVVAVEAVGVLEVGVLGLAAILLAGAALPLTPQSGAVFLIRVPALGHGPTTERLISFLS